MPAVSIIIPVYNQWELTRACLRALKDTTQACSVEVILVDNASTDITAEAAPFLGSKLFGGAFIYIRNDANRNFAGASNQGAAASSGEFLLFLNNDTVPLQGWLEPLLEDFLAYSGLAGTGPLLLYPKKPLVGHTVQHLGVAVSPFLTVNHLYEGIPADSPLAQKRRFFQIITAACLLMPKNLFQKMGAFDEDYKNGFEDVDLCARLSASGYRFTVNPASRVIHYQGQTAGRKAAEEENSKRMLTKAQPLLKPDKERLLEADGLSLGLNAWQIQTPLLPSLLRDKLNSEANMMDKRALLAALVENPFWSQGWKRLLGGISSREKETLAPVIFRLVPEPGVPMAACHAASSLSDNKKTLYWFNTASVFCRPESVYQDVAANRASLALSIGDTALARIYEKWASAEGQFFRERLRPFIAAFGRLAKELGITAPAAAPWAFALDFDLKRKNPYGGDAKHFNATTYRKIYPDVSSQGIDPWLHYLTIGKAEGRKPCVQSRES